MNSFHIHLLVFSRKLEGLLSFSKLCNEEFVYDVLFLEGVDHAVSGDDAGAWVANFAVLRQNLAEPLAKEVLLQHMDDVISNLRKTLSFCEGWDQLLECTRTGAWLEIVGALDLTQWCSGELVGKSEWLELAESGLESDDLDFRRRDSLPSCLNCHRFVLERYAVLHVC